jgi:NAD(P)-dependent dehydrogenase (short-subunit alcohol dehydrogenase family)
MSGRAALVTGGSSGIGLAIARALGADGYGLTIAAHRPRRLARAAEGLRDEGLEVQPVSADVGREEDVAALIARHRDTYGRLDVLVNSAGTGAMQRIEKVRTRLLDRIVAVNLRGLVLCTREALPLLRESGAEHGKALIVNVASISGTAGQAQIPVYAATKAGAIVFTRSTQQQVAGAGVQCTALAPGLVDTPMADYARDRLPGAEMVQPEDMAEAVRFLLRTSHCCHVPEIDFLHPAARPSDEA